MLRVTLIAALALLAGGAWAGEALRLQLKWTPQAQFAGYYVARDKGFYAEEELEVTIAPGGPEIAPMQVLAEGGADVAVDWMPAALVAREKGLPVVNIAQPFTSSGLMLVCRKDSGITEARTGLRGRTLGTWFSGNEYPVLSWMARLGLPTEGGPQGVTLLAQGADIRPLLDKRAACISAMSYNEYGQLLDAGLEAADLVVLRPADQDAATLEDGLYTLQQNLNDPAMAERLGRFVRASMKGWRYAEVHPDEAARIVAAETGADDTAHQRRMMEEVAKLTAGSDGALDPADAARTVDLLLSGRVIWTQPEGAWSAAITDRARQ